MILALSAAVFLASAGVLEDDCDIPAHQATCKATVAKVGTDKQVDRAYRAALSAAVHADRDPDWTRPDYTNNESYAESLRQSQRAWQSFADKQCAFDELEERYGTQHGVLFQSCYEKLARDRINWLNGVTRTYR